MQQNPYLRLSFSEPRLSCSSSCGRGAEPAEEVLKLDRGHAGASDLLERLGKFDRKLVR